MELTSEFVAQKVRERLVGAYSGVTLELKEKGVRQIDDWWLIPIRPSRPPKPSYEFSDTFSQIMDELKSKDQVDVIFCLGETAEEEQETQRYKEEAPATQPRLPKMLRPTKAAVLEIVRERLKDVRPCGVPLVVQAKGMYKVDNKWWRVPIHPLEWPEDKDFRAIYEVMAEVEDNLQTDERLPIVLTTGWPLTEEEKAEARAA